MNELDAFKNLNQLFKSHGFKLFMVGGTVRDFLLKEKLTDMDLVTDAKPSEIKTFLDADFTFEKMGSIKAVFENVKFDITTLRKEKNYKDFRHPNEIKFVKSLRIDVKRRDFTVNGLYLNDELKVIDYVNGEKDLKEKILRTIGNPNKRIKEDPLRILRALRFSLVYRFSIDPKLEDAIFKHKDLLKNLSKDKIKQEIKKIKNVDKEEIIKLFNKYTIKYILDMVE